MSFEAAWGFDPEKTLRAQAVFPECAADFAAEVEKVDPRALRLPVHEDGQIYELRRMFRL